MTTASERIHVGSDTFRVIAWQGDPTVALLAPLTGGRPPSMATIRRCIDVLAQRGVHEVVTGALATHERDAYLKAGFAERERLHLLANDLSSIVEPTTSVRLRRGRTADRSAVLTVDAAAFDGFWRLDQASLLDALDATSASRFRVTVGSPLAGYLITGRAGPRGYLQRLAVLPQYQRAGVATALVADGLRWLRRHGCHVAMVNTQESNGGALALYERLGFRREPSGLAVLAYRIESPQIAGST